tara:strand:+ start:935 stop:2035 length:1101 start_codon:yes stop_codon:yes gene_type:complete
MKLPRFVQKQKLSGGKIFYRFNPPQKYVDAGVSSRVNIGYNLSEARQVADKLNAEIDEYVAQQKGVVNIDDLNSLVYFYKKSNDYNMLASKTKVDYDYCIVQMVGSQYKNKDLGDMNVKDINGPIAKQIYEMWINRGISMANHICSVARKIFSFGMEMGYIDLNPFTTFTRRSSDTRKIVWTKEQMIDFLNVAYSDFKYRNVGLIAQMAYEWCQRIGDMRLLSFDSIDFDNAVLHLQQSKRRARVELPISDNLFSMLQQQREEFGFQQYVAPYYKTMGGMFIPYSLQRLSVVGKKIMQKAGLPNNLWLMDFRRTGTTEMVEAGVSMGQIMSVTGHANPSSVKPYMKNTLASADSALSARKEYLNNS